MGFDIRKVREDFPILNSRVHGKPLVYLDNAATTLKPISMVKRVEEHYLKEASNIHRGVHYLSERATQEFEKVREQVREFIGARSTEEIIFTKGTTDSINLVVSSFGRTYLKTGDEILITEMEHHSNIVPWQMLCLEKGLKLKFVPLEDDGSLNLETFKSLISDKTKFISFSHVSNSLGTVNPIEEMIAFAKSKGIPTLVDAAQSVAHMKVNVEKLGCDFMAFSAHKMFGPTGVGILYGQEKILKRMPPAQGGGNMILSVTMEKTIYSETSSKFEAGTPHIAGVIGFGAALNYINSIGLDEIAKHDQEILNYATKQLEQVEEIRLIGTAKKKCSILSMYLGDVHPHDVGTLLDQEGIAVRTGHHCTQPVMKRFNVPATVRASFSIYNTKEEVDVLVSSLKKVLEVFR